MANYVLFWTVLIYVMVVIPHFSPGDRVYEFDDLPQKESK